MAINKNDLLRPPLTAEYEPPDLALSQHFFHPNQPLFTLWHVDAMLTDARVRFGLDLLRGPILSNAHFQVHCKNEIVRQFVVQQINRFWRTGAPIALRSMEYGYLGCEIIFRSVENQLHYDKLKFLHPKNTRVVTVKGEFVGLEVSRVGNTQESVYVGRPKAFWTVHARDNHIWYGRSRLRGAFLAWNEIWSDHGYRDQRRIWFYKNAYAGPKIGFPPGRTPSETPGAPPIDHAQLAQEIADKMVSGTAITYPIVSMSPDGGWKIEDANPISIPEGLLEYGDQLRDEIWEGMGIPPEVARAEGTGAFAGRRVPQQAFYSVLQEIMQDIITDFDEQIINPLTKMNFGTDDNYEIECFGLLRAEEQEDMGDQGGFGRQPGDNQSGGQETGSQPGAMSIVLPAQHLGPIGAANHFGKNLIYYANAGCAR